MVKKATRWLRLFEDFIRDLRIQSKEVSSADERGVKLELWDSQKRFLKEVAAGMEDDVRIFNALKSRQLGITTISLAIDVFWLAMHPNIKGALVTDTDANRNEDRFIIKRYIKSFPENYFGESFGIVDDNRDRMTFTNGASLIFLVAGVRKKHMAWGEGKGLALVHLTEVASYGDPEGLQSFEESFAQHNPDRLFIYESTAKGFNHWRDKWLQGRADHFNQRSFFIGWWANDLNIIPRSDPKFIQYRYAATGAERQRIEQVASMYGHVITPEQLAWIRYKEEKAGREQDLLEQNQPWTENEAFVQSGYSFFQVNVITKDRNRLEEENNLMLPYRYDFGSRFFDMKLIPIRDEEDLDRIELKVWEEPVNGAAYVIGFDPAYGRNDHKDRHCASVWRCFADRIVQVAEYADNNVEVRFASWVLAHLAGAYEDCIVNIEVQGPGRMVFQEWDSIRGMLQADMNRDVVKQRDWEYALSQARWYLYARPDAMTGMPSARGFESTWKSKAEMMHQMRGAYVTGEIVVRSKALLGEMSNVVVSDEGVIGAPESRSETSKDDRVFAAALANRAWLNWRRPELIAQGRTWQLAQDEESGEASKISSRITRQVYRFLQTQEEMAAAVDPRPAWKLERGLI